MGRTQSSSVWYPRYVGDYQRKTSHLLLAEHGAYVVLLDHYYSTGLPLPANAELLHRICRAFAPHEVDAVQSVLAQFFVKRDDGYHNERADEELLRRGELSEKRKNAAQTRHSKSAANADANAHTATVTVTDVPSEHIKPSTKVKRAPKVLRYLGEDDPLEPDFYAVAVEYPGLDIHTEWEKFRDYHVAKHQGTGSIKASARTWCRNATKFSQPRLAVVR